jgi:hypothetical protein
MNKQKTMIRINTCLLKIPDPEPNHISGSGRNIIENLFKLYEMKRLRYVTLMFLNILSFILNP